MLSAINLVLSITQMQNKKWMKMIDNLNFRK